MYRPEDLKRIQACGRYVMEELDRVCTELGINYVVYGGTAIGAVRHQGFIPWDDDVDVCMPREDYERLFREAPALLGDHFELMDYRTHPDYPKTFGLLGLRESAFIPKVAARRKFRVPIGVDIFPLDSLAEEPAQRARQKRATWLWGRLLYLYGTPTAIVSGPWAVRAGIGAVLQLIHHGLHLMRVKPQTLAAKWERAARYEGTSNVLGDFSTRDPERWSASYDEMFPAQRMTFDDISVMVAKEYDSVLSRQFGTYMDIPPKDQQVNHEAQAVMFGPYAPEARC